ncbi:hypothetical protein KC865_03790 [Candidatus Kaiserbacteria bacterium]|nr:hypothetical protein [Candidatus Kaiserbacteria bacterium]USN92268.1 MAG: hypothetical protein H6782_00370 [Candidatus Nomurabacteria bacterium]
MQAYNEVNPLSEDDKRYIFDALKLIFLLGISWSDDEDFEEGRKAIESLNSIGREDFYKVLFS